MEDSKARIMYSQIRKRSSEPASKEAPAWQTADISEVPVEGQALLDYARQDKVFRQLRRTPWPNSGDADMMAGAYELLLIYRKFIEQRGSSRKGKQEWTKDVRSEEFLLGAHRCACSLLNSEQLQQEHGEDEWVVRLPIRADYPAKLYGGLPPVPPAIATRRRATVK